MKLLDKFKFNKKLLLFIAIIGIIGVISGSLFVTILNSSDKQLVLDSLNNFLDNIQYNKIDYLLILKNNFFTNLTYVLLIWLLGISVIGLPILIIIFFLKTFILGFSIGSIILSFKLKGILFSLVYVFPGGIISLLAVLLLTIYAMSLSIKIIYSLIYKKAFDFKLIINRYYKILLLSLIMIIVSTLYDTYVMPNIVKGILSFIR